MDISDLLDELNSAQREAVSAPPGNLLVLAGAGSGKTRVLVHRIAWLVRVERVSPYGVLAVTFTNKAAQEMRQRTEALLGIPVAGMWVGTFHGICHRLLRQHWQEAGLSKTFQIIDSQDQQRLVKRVLKNLELDESRWPPKQAAWFINSRKEEGIRPANIPDGGDLITRHLVRVYAAYEETCRRMGVIDFAELLLRTLELLRDNDSLLNHYQQRFRHLLVDEFQDTNSIQYALLRLLVGKRGFVFAVGDDDQSIYGWRGARIENIQHFAKDLPNTQTIRLEQNYRSTGNILKAANHLISNNLGRLGKQLWTEKGDGQLIDLYAAYNEVDEARYIAERIQHWFEGGDKRSDVAVLYRSNAQSRVFEETFISMQIPYRVYGGLRFFERAEIKDALAYTRLCVNRDDDASLERIINHPPRGIGERTLEIVRELARETDVSQWQAALHCIGRGLLNNRATQAVQRFVQLIDEMAAQIENLELFEQIDHIVQASGLFDHYSAEKGEQAQTRKENLDELVSAARAFEYETDADETLTPMDAFLTHAVLESGETQGGAWEDCVQMMTLHSAKGLEFPLVFLCGLEEGLFPHQMSLQEPGRLEEERRLCYVGITRAQQQLVLSYAENRRLHGREHFCQSSRFLEELPVEQLQEVRPRVMISRPVVQARNRTVGPVEGLNVGQRVIHKTFGEGIVLNYEGHGSHARVQVNFEDAGSKWMVLAYANLQVL